MPADTFIFTNSRGQALHAVACLPPGGALACRAVLVFLHGYSEHTGCKLQVFEQLAAAGVGVYAYDMHGHGRSKPQGLPAGRCFWTGGIWWVGQPAQHASICRRELHHPLHGHGRSDPKEPAGRALLLDWRHLVDDMCDFAEHARKRYAAAATTLSSANSSSNDNAIPSTHATQAAAAAAAAGSNVPWLLGGYSVGALTAVHAALRQQGSWSGLVLVSAALGLYTHGLLTRVQAALGGLLNATLPRRKLVKGLVTQQLNPDPVWVSEYDADPLVYHGNARVCTVYQFGQYATNCGDLHQAINALQGVGQQLLLPTFVLHATADKVTQYEAARDFAAGVAAAELCTVEGGYHDLLSGAGSRQHAAGIAGWINRSFSMTN